MVRISDIVKLGQVPDRPAPSLAVPPPSPTPAHAVSPKAITRPFHLPSAATSRPSLYEQLLAECQQRFAQVQQEDRLTLGQLPALMEQAVARMAADDAELLTRALASPKDFSFAHHGINVAVLAVSIGCDRDMKPRELVDLGVAAALHDVGMVPLSDLIRSPQALEDRQRAHLEEHPLMSHRLFQHCPNLPPLALDIALQEHERCDGRGYPHRLTGSRINQQAQVVGLLDVYESLTHDRPHRRHLAPAQAIRSLLHDHGDGFYTNVLRSFLRVIPIYPVGTWVRMNTGGLAQVLAVNHQAALFPTVSMRQDPEGRLLSTPVTVDLSKASTFSIVDAVAEPALS